MVELGVNIDHVATLREARKGDRPNLVAAAKICELAGAHQITVHLRQDRRHIQDRDLEDLMAELEVRMNLEMAAVDEIEAIAHRTRPHTVCIVPENRQEITTEGGLDVSGNVHRLTELTKGMHDRGIRVSLFIDPEVRQVDAAVVAGADYVELHTGAYANATGDAVGEELERLRVAGAAVMQTGLGLHAGHGLTADNLEPIARLVGMSEVNIGHDIIARAVFIGLENAVSEILDVLRSVKAGTAHG
jgi:pyridoxine 5-phosphate synthase